MKLNDRTMKAFKKHVLAQYPKEACGLVVGGRYVPCKNVADDPEHFFEIGEVDYFRARAKGPIQAVLHSHPYKLGERLLQPAEWPTTADMETWLAWKAEIPFGIVGTEGQGLTRMVWLDEAEPEPILGREFIHGVNDCYSVVRDWYRQERGITLKNFARGYGWWDENQNLYMDNFAAAGFEEITLDEIEVGDVLLMKIGGAAVIHHAAVVTGTNEITHHMFHRLSCTDRVDKWMKCIEKVVRFNPELLTTRIRETDEDSSL